MVTLFQTLPTIGIQHTVKQKMLKDTLQINVNIIYNKPKTKTLFLFQAVSMFNSALKLDI